MKRPSLRFFCQIFISITLLYIFFVLIINGGLFGQSSRSYYNHLLEAFFHSRLDLVSEINHDLSFFGNKWYLYWGPAPVLFILPFYLFTRLNTSDVFYTVMAGLVNIFVFYFVIEEFSEFFRLKSRRLSQYLILLSFSFASPNFYLSLGGRVWHTYQVIAIFYLLLFLFFYFKFLNRQDRLSFFALSVLFVNLAWLSRYTLIFNLFFLSYPLYLLFKNNRIMFRKALFIFFGLTICFVMIFVSYNYLRFGDPLETGWRYQVGSERYSPYFKTGKLLSTDFIYHNFTYYFLNHLPVSLERPYLRIDPEGNSVFSVYPILLFLFALFRMKILKEKKTSLFLKVTGLVVGLNLLLLMLNIGTGWVQFGNRYFFDVIPILFLLVLLVIEEIPTLIQLLALIYGFLINILGALLFYQIKI